MSRRLLLLVFNSLPRTGRHSPSSQGMKSLHCQRCLLATRLKPGIEDRPHQLSAARGLQQSAAAPSPERDPTRRQSPDLLYRRLELELRAHDQAVLDSYVAFLQQAARHLNVTVGKLHEPPRHFERMSLLKSVHIFAKHKVQYETRTYFRVLELLRLTASTADTYLEYSQRMLPEGVAMKVTRYAREPLPEHLSQRVAPVEPQQADGTAA